MPLGGYLAGTAATSPSSPPVRSYHFQAMV